MKFNADQNKIALASSITPTGVVAVVSGWGLTVVNGRPSPDLLMIYVMTLAPKDCQGEIGKKAVIRDNQICTQVPTGSGVCQVIITATLSSHPCCKFRNKNQFRFNPYISDSFRSIMNECEICFRCTDSFVVEGRITPSDYHSFFFSPN